MKSKIIQKIINKSIKVIIYINKKEYDSLFMRLKIYLILHIIDYQINILVFNRFILYLIYWGLGIGDWAQSPIPNPQSPK